MPPLPEKVAQINQLSKDIIGAAIEVHRHLGPGLLESTYEACLVFELRQAGIPVEPQKPLPIVYKGLELPEAYRLDLLVADTIVVELKAVDKLEKIHEAQLLTYLRLTGRWLGLLINFNTVLLKDGVKRLVQG
jgi:GxxExxY protein